MNALKVEQPTLRIVYEPAAGIPKNLQQRLRSYHVYVAPHGSREAVRVLDIYDANVSAVFIPGGAVALVANSPNNESYPVAFADRIVLEIHNFVEGTHFTNRHLCEKCQRATAEIVPGTEHEISSRQVQASFRCSACGTERFGTF